MTSATEMLPRRPRVGFIVPPVGDVIPGEALRLYPQGIDFVARGLGIRAMVAPEFDKGLQILETVALDLMGVGVDAISVMGTSLTFYRGAAGNEEILRRLRAVTNGIPVTTMSMSVIATLKRRGAQRVAVVAAYTEEMTGRLISFLRESEIHVVSSVNLGLESIDRLDRVGDKILESAVYRALQAGDAPDAVLISCGGLRPRAVVERVERVAGIPIVSSAVDGVHHATRLIFMGSSQSRV